jgi:beta-N-acetylhexosaminidase
LSRRAKSAASGWAAAAALGLCGGFLAGAPPGGLDAATDPVPGLRQLIGQRIVYGFPGRRIPPRLLARVRRGEAAGVILFRRNIGSRGALRALTRRLRAAALASPARAPLLVMVDQEGGLVKRLSGAPRLSPAQMGRGGPGLAAVEGRATAHNLRSVGINVDLAPVVDIGRPGSATRRLGRSFGSRPSAVATLGAAFARGLQGAGVAATLKHFPGLGPVRSDEDLLVQTVRESLARLRRVDERPFAAGTQAGARLVMTSTARYRALGGGVAMLSRRVVTGELRRHLRFGEVTLTDDLDVPALRGRGGPVRLALAAARAGNDLLLFSSGSSASTAFAGLLRLAQRGRLGEPGLRAAAGRVLALRRSLR